MAHAARFFTRSTTPHPAIRLLDDLLDMKTISTTTWIFLLASLALAWVSPAPAVIAQDAAGNANATPKPTERTAPIPKRQKPATKKPTGSPTVGPTLGDNTATPIDRITASEEFQVKLLYSVPGQEQGSWVNLCTDNRGRLLVSDQYGGLYRLTPPPAGKTLDAAHVEKVPAAIRAVNGMVWAFGALYVGVNDYEQKIPSGFYRITDSDGDDQLDKVELLREIQAKGDHGVHAVVPTPDGKAFYLITGNNARYLPHVIRG